MLKAFQKLEYRHQALFTILVLVGIVTFWRGLWRMLDVYLFPESPALSIGTSIGFGLVILLVSGYLTKQIGR